MYRKSLLYILILILLFPSLVSAQMGEIVQEWFHLPEYKEFSDYLYFVFIPFLGTFTIAFGVLTQIGIFKNKKINMVIALIFAFSLLYYGILTYLVHLAYSVGGFLSVIIFVGLFIFGIIMWAKKKGEDYREGRFE